MSTLAHFLTDLFDEASLARRAYVVLRNYEGLPESNVGADIEADHKEAFHPWFESEASDDETRALLEVGLKELPEKFAEVITMKIWGERTFAEIGEALGISQNTAASRYRYGLEALKKHLGGARRRGDLSI